MSKAFVVEWSPLGLYSPMIGRVYYSRGCRGDVDDPRRNYCDFSFNARGALYTGSYLVNSAYEAKVLTRLLKRVSNFQIYCAAIKRKNQDQLCNFKEAIKSLFDEQSCYTGWSYIFNYPGSQNIRENIDISEIDTKQPLKLGPCFFYDQYKMHDENGHPLYMAVAIERKNDGTEDADLFNYKVKFIGSGQPLPKQWQPISLCNDVACYNQKSAKYKREHAAEYENYANKIWAWITDSDYKKKFETYSYKEALEWDGCEVTRKGIHCPNALRAWGVGKLECRNPRCQFRKREYRTIHHDGEAYYNNFEHIFGSELAQLAKNGALKDQHKSLMPDFSDPEFIDKFNKAQGGIQCLHYFDDNGNIRNRQMHLNGTLGHIKYWAQRPDFDVLRFVYCGNVQTISSLQPKTEEIEPEVTEDSAIFPTDLKTRLLWHNMDRVKFPAIYMKSPGGKRIIDSDIYAAYDYVNEEEHIYYDYIDTSVVYAKPKGEKETTYYFPYPWRNLGYNLQYLMDDVHDIQTHDSNLKWEPSKMFPKDEERIEVMRANVDYNGITILNPQKMSPIKCDHYEIRESQYDSGVDIQTKSRVYANNILLFDKKGQVSGIIHTWHVDKIIPHIIAMGQAKQK